MKYSSLKIPLLSLVVLAGAAPAFAQADFAALISGQAVPLSLKLGQLTPEWRRLTAGGQQDTMSSWMRLMMGGGGGGKDVYYTRGQTVTAGGETYLVAYQAPSKDVDIVSLMRMGPGGAPAPAAEPLTRETELTLGLLNQRTMGSLVDIRPFNLQQELAPPAQGPPNPARATAQNAASNSNLKQLALGLMQFAQDNDEKLPDMKDAATVRKAILPYVKNEEVFVYPGSKQAYLPNPQVSNMSLADIPNPATTIILYEASAAADGTRGVAYADGHVARHPEAEWQEMRRRAKIPEADKAAARPAEKVAP